MNRETNIEVWHLACAAALCYPACGIVVTAQRRRENLQNDQ